jgi:exodeoxyribonuclease VII large subunit
VSTHGPAAAAAIAWGVGTTWRRDVDVVLVVRGGGAAVELTAFDDERVARAVARCPRPVWVAVGHSGDRSVADACAQRSFPTPSAAAAALVAIAASVEQGLDDAATRIGRSAAALSMACSDRLGSTSSAVTSLARAIVVEQEAAVNLIETTIVGLGRAEAADRRARSLTVVAAVAVLLLAAVVLLVALGVRP